MQVQISVPGEFWAFQLGRYLEKQDVLDHIYTSHPKSSIDTAGIPSDKVTSFRYTYYIQRIGQEIPYDHLISRRWEKPFRQWKNNLFDRLVARNIRPAENGIFIGYSGACLQSLKRANELSVTSIVERASAHARTQKEILDKEYKAHIGTESPISEAYVKREEKEYAEADYIVTPSEFVRQSFLEQGMDKDKIKVVPLGTDIPDQTVDAGQDPFYFIFVGTLSLRKGLPYLLNAWDQFDRPNCELLVVGGIEENIEYLVTEYGERDDIHFTGWTDKVNKILSMGSVFVFPSVEDGFGRVVIEAMAMGLPIIVSENTGAKDCIEDGTGGMVIPSRDNNKLVNAMEYMYDNPDERAVMATQARKRVMNRYTIEDYWENIFDVLETVQ